MKSIASFFIFSDLFSSPRSSELRTVSVFICEQIHSSQDSFNSSKPNYKYIKNKNNLQMKFYLYKIKQTLAPITNNLSDISLIGSALALQIKSIAAANTAGSVFGILIDDTSFFSM